MLAFGQRLASCINSGDCIALHGTLGAGKTTLIRGLIKALMGADYEVPSPTFTLVQTYEPSHPLPMIWHFDLYRLENSQDVMELGWETALEDIALIEWPMKAAGFLPSWTLALDIEFSAGKDHDTGRKITFKGEGWREARFSPLFA